MVSFSCEVCNDVVPKKKLDQHRNQCRGASFTCLDCMQHFRGTDYRAHTSCITEAQKYQGHLFKEKNKLKCKSVENMVPRRAYVEDVEEGGEESQQVVAVIEVPPKAPSPPPAPEVGAEMTEAVNVFDFLVANETPNGDKTAEHDVDERRMVEHPVYYGNGEYGQYAQYTNGDPAVYMQYGFSYGNTPVPPSTARYDSWHNLTDSQQSQGQMDPPYVTPAPKAHRREKRDGVKRVSIHESSEKKRKRHQVEDLDLSSAKRPPARDHTMTDAAIDSRTLHSGLTGGLSKLVTDPEFYEDRIAAGPTPILSPIKRTRREGDDKKADRRKSSYASYNTITIKPSSSKRGDERHEHKYHDDGKRHHRSRSLERIDERHRGEDRSTRYHDDRHHRAQQLQRQRDSMSSSEDKPNRKHLRAIEYPIERPASVQPTATNQLVSYKSRADLFMSFIKKGPDSERGCSLNKVLKRYHRERDVRGEEKEEDDKELWKGLRLRRNDRGEIVLFI